MEQRYRVILTPRAQIDLREIDAYLASEVSPATAEAFIDRLLGVVESLERFPRRFPAARESALHRREIRQAVVASYRVLFVIREREVYVLRIGHGARRTLPPL